MTMQNSKSEFKEEFKKRITQFVLNLIQFIDSLSKDTTCKIIAGQLIRSGIRTGNRKELMRLLISLLQAF
jgi:hypothetical protein